MEEETIDLKKYFRLLKRWLWLLAFLEKYLRMIGLLILSR